MKARPGGTTMMSRFVSGMANARRQERHRWHRWLFALVVAGLCAVPSPSFGFSDQLTVRDVGLFPGPGQMRVTWAAVTGWSAVTAIQVDAQPGPASCTARPDLGTCTITGLRNGQAYTFAFSFIGASGLATATGDVAGPAWPCCEAPGAPQNVRAEASLGSAVVSWEPPGNVAGSGGNFTYSVESVPSGSQCETSERSCRIEGLADGTGYTFLVRASNTYGTSNPGVSPSVTPLGPPGSPTDVRVFLRDRGRATVSWLGPAKTGGAIVDRYVAVADPGGASCTSRGALQCDLTGLSNGLPYRFTVTAYNQYGAGPASPPSQPARPLAGPGEVRSLSVATAGTRATIRWSAPRSDGGAPIRAYAVRSSPAGGTCTTRGLSCTVTGLRPGQRYVFVVQGRNSKGLGLTAQTRSVTIAGAASSGAAPQAPLEPSKPEVPLS